MALSAFPPEDLLVLRAALQWLKTDAVSFQQFVNDPAKTDQTTSTIDSAKLFCRSANELLLVIDQPLTTANYLKIKSILLKFLKYRKALQSLNWLEQKEPLINLMDDLDYLRSFYRQYFSTKSLPRSK